MILGQLASLLSVTLSLSQTQPLVDFFSETLTRRMESIKSVYSKGEKSAAIIELKHLIQEVPLYLNAYTLLAEYQLADGDRTSAISTLKSAVDKAAPALRPGLRRKIKILSKFFRSHENYSEFQQSIKLINEGSYASAKQKLEVILKKEEDHGEVLLRLGQVHFLLAEFRKSVLYFEKGMQMDSKHEELLSWLGRSYFLLGDVKKSEKIFKQISWDSDELSEQSAYWWSDVLLATKGKRTTLGFLEKQLEDHPKWVRILVKCAELRSTLISKNSEPQWQAKKELQLALSRFDDYASKETTVSSETPLGINQLNLPELKKQIQEAILVLEEKLKKLDEVRP